MAVAGRVIAALPDWFEQRFGAVASEAAVTLGQSGAGVWRLTLASGEVVYLKVGSGDQAASIVGEAARLRWLAGRVPTARLLAVERDDAAAWLVTAALPGEPAGDLLVRDRSTLPLVVAGLASFLKMLHALPAKDCPFDGSVAAMLPIARARVDAGDVDEDDFDDDHRGWSAAAVLAEVEELSSFADGRVVTHGDFTLGNILVDSTGAVTGCLDVGRLGVADPYQDIALCWRDLGGFEAAAQSAFLAAVGCASPDASRLRLHCGLDELF